MQVSVCVSVCEKGKQGVCVHAVFFFFEDAIKSRGKLKQNEE